ncbi:MAG: LacI family DNA-binding transcriptional regulator [Verrucomicrobiota bacterium]
MITQRDLAQKLNLSQATISMALQNNPRIPQKLRDRIHKKAAELGYIPSPDLRSLSLRKRSTGKSIFRSTIAVIGQWKSPAELKPHDVYEGYWKGIQRQAENLGYKIDYFQWNPETPNLKLPQTLHARGIHGAILLPYIQPLHLAGFDCSKLATVTFGYSVMTPHFHRVSHNHYQSLFQALEQLQPGRFQKIGFTSYSDHRLMNLWTAAYLTYHHIHQQKTLPLFTHSHAIDAEAFLKWYHKNQPDLILTSHPQSVREILEKNSIRIPQKVSILSYSKRDGQEWFTGVKEESIEAGIAAVNWVDQLQSQHQYGIPKQSSLLLVSGNLVESHSLCLENRSSSQVGSTLKKRQKSKTEAKTH